MNKKLLMKALGAVPRGIFILCIPILCLSMAISWEITTPRIYTYGFDKYHVSEIIEISHFELKDMAIEFANYFSSSKEELSTTIMTIWRDGELIPMFTADELIHFKDVQRLIRWDRYLICTALGYLVLSIIWWGRGNLIGLGRTLMAGAGLTLGLLLALVLGIIVNFDQLFLQFHIIAFRNNLWSAPGYMLKLFPVDFWYDIVLFTVLVSSLLAIFFGGLGFGLTKFARKRSHSPS